MLSFYSKCSSEVKGSSEGCLLTKVHGTVFIRHRHPVTCVPKTVLSGRDAGDAAPPQRLPADQRIGKDAETSKTEDGAQGPKCGASAPGSGTGKLWGPFSVLSAGLRQVPCTIASEQLGHSPGALSVR